MAIHSTVLHMLKMDCFTGFAMTELDVGVRISRPAGFDSVGLIGLKVTSKRVGYIF